MTNKQIIVDDEHDMNYCEDNNCKHYGNKEQCEKTHCYYRSYSKLYTAHKSKEQECEELKKELMKKDEINTFFNTPIEGWSNDPCEICQYKQILAEIKGICKFNFTMTTTNLLAKTILQKISEVENETRP